MAFLGFGKKSSRGEPAEEKKMEEKKITRRSETPSPVAKKPAKEKRAKTAEESRAEEKIARSVPTTATLKNFDAGRVIIGPRITEKGAILAEDGNAYTFNVRQDANKIEIKKAIKEIYKIIPVRVNIVKTPSKKVLRRGMVGTKSGGKKAVVYLKKGDKIEFV